MSQTFNVYPTDKGMIQLSGMQNGERFVVTKRGFLGPNRLVVPQFTHPSGEANYICNHRMEKGPSIASNLGREIRGFHPTSYSKNLDLVKSQVGGYLELSTYNSRTPEIAVLEAQGLTKNNKSIYYLSLNGQCAVMDDIRLTLGDGTDIEFKGEIEMYSYDIAIVQLQVKLPPRARVRASFAQILPFKDSIIQKLSRIQYGQSSV